MASGSRASTSTGKDLGWNQQMEGYHRWMSTLTMTNRAAIMAVKVLPMCFAVVAFYNSPINPPSASPSILVIQANQSHPQPSICQLVLCHHPVCLWFSVSAQNISFQLLLLTHFFLLENTTLNVFEGSRSLQGYIPISISMQPVHKARQD